MRQPARSRPKRASAKRKDAFRRLPLASLRVFVAVAEHLSFTHAADALGVTVSATSLQIQSLEQYLGLQLLRRRGRLVELTEQGAALLPPIRDGLQALQFAIDAARANRDSGALRISLVGSFLLQWLLPRLPDFEARFPAISLRIETSAKLVDFARSDVQAAIRFGTGKWPGLHCEKLLDEWLVPVCEPALLNRLGPVHDQADLQRYRLLHSATEPWSAWLLGAASDSWPDSGYSFDDSLAVIRAAEAGGGLALARWSLVADEVRRGRLAVASKTLTPFERAYYFVCPPQNRGLSKVTAFADWLREQTRGHAGPRVT
jgi:LysR family transcriptional regulator, glycine cleavage system transcriptional activator